MEQNDVIQLLLVEDEMATRKFVVDALNNCSIDMSFRTETVSTLSEALDRLKDYSAEIILSNLELPDCSGISIIHRFREQYPDIPLIMITRNPDENIGIEAIRHGADDYLMKGKIYRDVLGRSIRYAIERKRQHKLTEQELRKSERFLQSTLNALSAHIAILDENGIILSVNQAWSRFATENHIAWPNHGIGRNYIDICDKATDRDAESAQAAAEGIRQVLEKRCDDFYWEYPCHGPNEKRWFMMHVTHFEDHGKIRIVIAHENITQRKLAEEKQAKLLHEIESANKELKDFAYITSHDLKAPLRGINTIVGWLCDDYADTFDETAKEQFEMLRTRVGRMHNLIEGILQYSRIGRIREDLIRIDLNELLQDVIESIAPPQHICVDITDPLPEIDFEPTRATQLFQNLIGNAIKYMDKPDGKIRIGCNDESSHWVFSVADNGPGIEEKHFDKIFKIFQTLCPRDEFESTGVGLTIVKKIVEIYNGEIWLESEPGQGTTFFVRLPKETQMVEDTASQQKKRETENVNS